MDTKKIEKQAKFNYQILEMPLHQACEKSIQDNMSANEIGQMARELDVTVDDLVEEIEKRIN